MTTFVMEDCKGGCGVLVRPDAARGMCDACNGLSDLMADRRARQAAESAAAPAASEQGMRRRSTLMASLPREMAGFDKYPAGGDDEPPLIETRWRELLAGYSAGTLVICVFSAGLWTMAKAMFFAACWLAAKAHPLLHLLRVG